MTATDTQSALQSLQRLFGGAPRRASSACRCCGSAWSRSARPARRICATSPRSRCSSVCRASRAARRATLLAGERGSSAVAFLDAPGWTTRLVCQRAARDDLRHRRGPAGRGRLAAGASRQSARSPRSRSGVAGVFFASIAKALAAAFASDRAERLHLAAAADQPDFERIARDGAVWWPPSIACEALEAARARSSSPSRSAALEALHKPLSQVPRKDTLAADPGWTQQIEKEVPAPASR